MNVKNKKGVSGVVTAVLLILLVIAAVGILAVVVQNFVKEGTSGVAGSANCLATTYDIVSVNTAGDITIRRTNGDAAMSALRGAIGTGNFVDANNQSIVIGQTTTIAAGGSPTGVVDVSLVYALSDGTACPAPGAQSIGVS